MLVVAAASLVPIASTAIRALAALPREPVIAVLATVIAVLLGVLTVIAYRHDRWLARVDALLWWWCYLNPLAVRPPSLVPTTTSLPRASFWIVFGLGGLACAAMFDLSSHLTRTDQPLGALLSAVAAITSGSVAVAAFWLDSRAVVAVVRHLTLRYRQRHFNAHLAWVRPRQESRVPGNPDGRRPAIAFMV